MPMAMYHGNIGIGKMMIIIEVEVISDKLSNRYMPLQGKINSIPRLVFL